MGSFLPPAPRASANQHSDPSPSFPAVLCCHSNREAANATRKLGLQIWPVSMETGGEGGATSSNPGSWPLCGTLSPSKEEDGREGGEALSTYYLFLHLILRDEPEPWQRGGGMEAWGVSGSQEIPGLLSCSPAGLGETAPQTGSLSPSCTPSSVWETDDCA